MFTGSASTEGLRELRLAAANLHAKGSRAVSTTLIVRRNGRWEKFLRVNLLYPVESKPTNSQTMKTYLTALALAATVITGFAAEPSANPVSPSVAKDSRCFEMRTYYAAPGKMEAMNARFRDHTCALFKKHGMELVGFWIPTDKEKGAENTLVYILAHKSREEAKKSWAAFVNDPDWKKARDASEANGKLVEKAEVVFMSATDYSPMK